MSAPLTTLFALEYHVVDDEVACRAAFRDAHLRLAQAADARGDLRIGGALGDPPARARLVFSSRAAAESFAAEDPSSSTASSADGRSVPGPSPSGG